MAHAFLLRQPGIHVSPCETDEAIRKLAPGYHSGATALGFSWETVRTVQQVHGAEIRLVETDEDPDFATAAADGLMTRRSGLLLGILVADCCAVYVVDPVRRAIALLHSGKKGTSLGILSRAIFRMRQTFGSHPRDLLVQLSPCIRPPHYEIDFAAEIRRQALANGVLSRHLFDTGECTACHLSRYYSYRIENGRTGRMLALLGYRAES